MREKYAITFGNVIVGRTNYKVAGAPDFMTGTVIKQHLNLWNDWSCDQVLSAVDWVVNGMQPGDNQTYFDDTVVIIEDGNISFDGITIPLSDFIAIVQEWKEFLLTPPLNRQQL